MGDGTYKKQERINQDIGWTTMGHASSGFIQQIQEDLANDGQSNNDKPNPNSTKSEDMIERRAKYRRKKLKALEGKGRIRRTSLPRESENSVRRAVEKRKAEQEKQ